MAPLKTIQTRSNYVPWLSEETKALQKERNTAHKKAADSNDPEDWRHFRSLRNIVTRSSKADKAAWEKKKLDDKVNSSTDIWKCVKGWLGWGSGGTPTKLYSGGELVTSPTGLSSTMNKFFLSKIKNQSLKVIKMREAMDCGFRVSNVTEEEVLKIIQGLILLIPDLSR